MAIAPQVLPGRAFAQNTPVSSLLFHWRAQDRSLVTVDRSSTGTLTRASAGGLTDGRGQRTANALTDVRLVGPAADNQPRWGVSTAGVPHLLLEDTRTNLLPIAKPTSGWQTSDVLSTAGTTTVAPDGTLVTLLTDNSTTAITIMRQDVEIASTVAVMTWYTKWNGSTFGAVHQFRVRDNTTGADRGAVIWEFGSTGAMTITSTGGGNVISAPAHIGNNWWKTSVECTAILTGNDNAIQIRPSSLSAATTGGDMFISEIQVEDVASTGQFASSHIPTVSAAVTRAAETLFFPFLPVPQAVSFYVKFIERGTSIVGNLNLGLLDIGRGTSASLDIREASGDYRILLSSGGNSVLSSASNNPALGDTVEVLGTMTSDGKVQIASSVNGNAIVSGTQSAALALPTAWDNQEIGVGHRDASSGIGFNAFIEVKVAADVQTMQQMRESM